MENIDPILSLTETLLCEHFGQAITLEAGQQFESPHLVMRCHLKGASDGIPKTVILKKLPLDDSKSRNPVWQSQRFLNEWACLQFLDSENSARLYTGIPEQRLLLVEDLGDHTTLQDLLLADDYAAAEKALIESGASMAQMQIATVGREGEFLAIQKALGATTPECDASVNVRNHLNPLRECLMTLGVDIPEDFYREVNQVSAAMHEPNPFRAFCHCDAGPHNLLCRDDDLLLVDFEFGYFTNALIDVVGIRLASPASYHGHRTPPELVRRMEAAYRAELVKGIPEAGDDGLFHEAMTLACAEWALCKLIGMWRGYLKARLERGESYDSQDSFTPEGTASYMQKNVTYFQGFVDTAAEFGYLPAIGSALEQVIAGIQRTWPEMELLPYYPAFRA